MKMLVTTPLQEVSFNYERILFIFDSGLSLKFTT